MYIFIFLVAGINEKKKRIVKKKNFGAESVGLLPKLYCKRGAGLAGLYCIAIQGLYCKRFGWALGWAQASRACGACRRARHGRRAGHYDTAAGSATRSGGGGGGGGGARTPHR